MARQLSHLVRVSLREAWKHEATDFTPWLAEPENLSLLADALGLDEAWALDATKQIDESLQVAEAWDMVLNP